MLAVVAAVALQAGAWQAVVPGLERRRGIRAEAEVEALRVDPAQLEVRVVLARDLGRAALTAREFQASSRSLAAINGGFFDPELRPIGLRMSGGRRVAGTLRPGLGALAAVGLPATFRVVLGSEIEELAGAREVVQCGPRLVVGGKPNRLKPQVSRRTVAGVDAAGRLVLLVTRRGVLDARDLALWLTASEAEGGFALRSALNLDGGGSTQMYLSAGGDEIDVPGLTPVADALVVVAPGAPSPSPSSPPSSSPSARAPSPPSRERP